MDGAGDLPHVLPALVATERFSLAADGAENSLPTMSQAEDVLPAIPPAEFPWLWEVAAARFT